MINRDAIQNMLTLLLTIVIAVSVSACGSNESAPQAWTTPVNNNSSNPVAAYQDAVVKIIKISDVTDANSEITINSIETSADETAANGTSNVPTPELDAAVTVARLATVAHIAHGSAATMIDLRSATESIAIFRGFAVNSPIGHFVVGKQELRSATATAAFDGSDVRSLTLHLPIGERIFEISYEVTVNEAPIVETPIQAQTQDQQQQQFDGSENESKN